MSEVAELLGTGHPFLLPAWEAGAVLGGEDIPDELRHDVRMPYRVCILLLGARFELTPRIIANLPSNDSGPRPYRPDLDAIRRHGGCLLGLLILSDHLFRPESRTGLLLGVNDRRRARGMEALTLVPSEPGAYMARVAEQLRTYLYVRTAPSSLTAARSAAGRPALSGASHSPGLPPSSTRVITLSERTTNGRSSGSSRGGAAHIRRAHWHRYRVGPRDHWSLEWRWIAPIWVSGSGPPDDSQTIYRV
jgi:hypothetical protein